MNYFTIVTLRAREMRKVAWESLHGRWGSVMLAPLIYLLAIQIPRLIINLMFDLELASMIGGLYTILVGGPFAYGIALFFITAYRRQGEGTEQVFYGFEKFGSTLLLALLIGLKTLAWTLLFVIPGIIAAYRYSQSFFIMVDHPEMGAIDCIEESKRLMNGNKARLFCLQFSFFGWALLMSIPTGLVSGLVTAMDMNASGLAYQLIMLAASIPYIWVTTYTQMAVVYFYELLNGNEKQGVIRASGGPEEPVGNWGQSPSEQKQDPQR